MTRPLPYSWVRCRMVYARSWICSDFRLRPPGEERQLRREAFMFYCWCLFLSFFSFLPFQREFSELPRPIAVKLCHVIGSLFIFIIQVLKFRDPPRKNLGTKMSIICHFRIWSPMSSKWVKLLTSWERHYQPQFVLYVRQKNLINFVH